MGALDIPAYIHTSITLSDAFSQSPLSGLTTDTPIGIDTPLTLRLAASSVYIYNGIDDNATGIGTVHPASDEEMVNGTRLSGKSYDLSGRKVYKPLRNSVNIVEGKKILKQ